jgi:hypothetical protein
MVLLAVMMSAAIAGIAAEHASQGRPAWHTWLASLGLIGCVAGIISAFILVGRQLPS